MTLPACLPIQTAMRQYPDQLAFVDADTRWTYADLERVIGQRLAADSRLADLKPGDHVAWCPSNDADAFLTFWCLLSRGMVACPVSHRFPIAKRNEILKRINAHWLSDSGAGAFSDQEEAVGGDRETEFDLGKPATIVLSSGSTGVPKAIVHSLAAHVASATGSATNISLAPGDRWLWSLPLFHISGLSILLRCAVAGATVVGMSSGVELNAGLLAQSRVTHLSVVNTQLRRLLAEQEFPSSQLKSVLLGGSNVDPKLVRVARDRGVNVRTTYGLTEMASQVTTSDQAGAAFASGGVLPGRELEISSSGEILVRGSTLCLGYYQAGGVRSVVDEAGWFHTGDLGYLDAGQQLIVIGRVDNMFVSGGENMHPENIERAMLRAFDIEQVVVVPKLDPMFGARPVAFVAGDLPSDWQLELRKELKGYEIPVEVIGWPRNLQGRHQSQSAVFAILGVCGGLAQGQN